MSEPVAWDEPVAWIRQRDNTLALSDGGVFGDDWTPLYSAALAQPEPVDESTLLALARRCLWIAYVWNDHNFVEDAHKYAKEEAEKCGIKSFEQSNDWLRSHSPQRKPLTDEQYDSIEHKAYLSTISKGKPMGDYAKKLMRAIERAHGII
jgi:hypothetical protein